MSRSHSRTLSIRTRSLALLALALPLLAGEKFPHISVSLYDYSFYDLPPALRDPVAQWQAKRFDLIINSSAALKPYATTNRLAGYFDQAAVYAKDLERVRTIADKYGFNMEDMLLHSSRDYSVGSNMTWQDIEQFDAFEQLPSESAGLYGQARNGAFLLNGSTYTDVTVAAYDTKAADVAINDKLLLGYAEPFDEINFVLAVASSGNAVSWQYWNGSAFAPLPVVTDGTVGLTQNGRIRFLPPADWRRVSQNGSRVKYWVQAVVSGPGAKPVASRIFGASWFPASGGNAMGWAASDPNIINKGLGALEYNPNPPAGASARFRYQARATGIWANNEIFGNPANVQLGQRTWAIFVADASFGNSLNDGSTAVFLDNVGAGPPLEQQCLDVPQDKTYQQHLVELFAAIRDRLHQLRPSFASGFNTTVAPFALSSDFSTSESMYVPWLGPPYYSGRPANDVVFDTFLPANNPTAARGYLQCVDAVWTLAGAPFWGGYHYWDRGNRSPMACLASYYIGSNQNTGLNYTTINWRYPETDEFYYFTATPTRLTKPLARDTSSNKKMLYVVSTAGMSNLLPVTYATVIRLGEPGAASGDIVQAYLENGALWTVDAIYNSYAAGTSVYTVLKGHQATDTIPPISRIWKWSPWFPAMAADVGSPDPSGYNGGVRNLEWLSGAAISGQPDAVNVCKWWPATQCPGVMRRDFTNAIVLFRTYHPEMGLESEYDTYSKDITLGGTYYPLQADGTTLPGVTRIRLRGAEGAILMKRPVRPMAR